VVKRCGARKMGERKKGEKEIGWGKEERRGETKGIRMERHIVLKNFNLGGGEKKKEKKGGYRGRGERVKVGGGS